MNILIATDNYPPRYDGISRVLIEVCPHLAKHHNLTILAPNFGPTEQEWKVIKIPTHKRAFGDFHPAKFRPITAMRAAKSADIVFIQTLGPIGFAAWIAAWIRRKPMVLYTHSIEWEILPKSTENLSIKRWAPGIIKTLSRFIYKRISRILIPGSAIADIYEYNKITTPHQIIPLGVDTKKFHPPRSKDAAKKKLGYDTSDIIIGYHGRLAREKGLKTLLRAYKRINKKHPQAKLLIVGDGLSELREQFEEHGANVTGFTPEVTGYLNAMDIYVLPSLTETSSLSVMEAMACKLPVCSTPVGFVKDYITHGENGLLFDMGHSAQLAHELEQLITDPKLRAKLGQNAQQTVKQHFDWKQTSSAILHALEDVEQAH